MFRSITRMTWWMAAAMAMGHFCSAEAQAKKPPPPEPASYTLVDLLGFPDNGYQSQAMLITNRDANGHVLIGGVSRLYPDPEGPAVFHPAVARRHQRCVSQYRSGGHGVARLAARIDAHGHQPLWRDGRPHEFGPNCRMKAATGCSPPTSNCPFHRVSRINHIKSCPRSALATRVPRRSTTPASSSDFSSTDWRTWAACGK